MSIWFYNEKGQSKGPVTAQMIVSLWSRGILKGEDLAYSQERGEWKTLLEWDDIRKLHEKEKIASEQDTFEQEIWILLQKNINGVFVQNGPFDTGQIIEMLKKAQAQPTDYVWKQGFDQWDQIQNRKEFNIQSPLLTEEQKKELTLVEEMPLPLPIKTDTGQIEKVSFTIEKPDSPLEKNQIENRPVLDNQKTKSLYVLIGIAIMIGGGLVYRGIRSNGEEKINPSVAIVSNNTVPVKPEVLPTVSDGADLKKEQKQDQKQVIVQERPAIPQELKPSNHKFQIEMKGQSLYISFPDRKTESVIVHFDGKSGDVLDKPAYYRRISEKINQSQEVIISSGQYSIPVGFYEVQVFSKQGVKIGGQKVFVGKDQKAYEQKISQHRKQISYLQQKEKKKILTAIDQIGARLGQIYSHKKQIPPQNFDAWWKKNITSYLPLEIAQAQSEKSELIYTVHWRKIGSQIDKMKIVMKQSIQQGRVPASHGFDSFKAQIVKIQKDVAKTSHSHE